MEISKNTNEQFCLLDQKIIFQHIAENFYMKNLHGLQGIFLFSYLRGVNRELKRHGLKMEDFLNFIGENPYLWDKRPSSFL